MNTLFRGARSVGELSAGTAADRPRVMPLIRSFKEYWGETSLAEMQAGRMRLDDGVDNKGPLTLAVAVESGSPGGNVDIGSTRLVVVGNSRCVADSEQSEANTALFLNSVNWLLERKSLLGIPPKPSRSYKIEMTPRQVQIVSLGSMLGLPLVAAMIGLLVWWRRRR
jgi:hypothetical protein